MSRCCDTADVFAPHRPDDGEVRRLEGDAVSSEQLRTEQGRGRDLDGGQAVAEGGDAINVKDPAVGEGLPDRTRQVGTHKDLSQRQLGRGLPVRVLGKIHPAGWEE